jgi:basic amino acid/polyamine antiporter, APA family
MEEVSETRVERRPALRRLLGLPLLVLYGTGITVGAGTAASYAEMATRYPVSAGEAA